MLSAVPTYFNFSHDVIDRWARETPQSLALWCVDEHGRNEQRITFQQLAQDLRRAASFFSSLGIQRGDRVLILLPRVPQWWVAMLGLLRLGAVPVPATPMLTEKDIRYRLGAANIRAVMTDEADVSKFASFAGIRVLVGADCPGWSSFDTGLRQADPGVEFEPTRSDEPGILFFTSGTSGPPKMALHTHASYGYAHHITGRYWLDLKPGEVHWVLADPGWAKAAWSALFGPWHMGACIFVDLTLGKFHPRSTLKTLSTYPINTFCAPPTAYRLITHEDVSGYRFPRLRHCVAAGESLTVDVFRKWKNATGLDIYEGYGQTETVVLVGNFRSTGREIRPGSMGHPSPGYELALLDDQLNPVVTGKEGQIAIHVKPRRPTGLFKEYWRSPEE
ncbi:MAG: AMP-binding protein, partial [Bacillota bacterium]